MDNDDGNETRVVRHYWGLTWPTLIGGGIVVLAVLYAIYRIYALALTQMNG